MFHCVQVCVQDPDSYYVDNKQVFSLQKSKQSHLVIRIIVEGDNPGDVVEGSVVRGVGSLLLSVGTINKMTQSSDRGNRHCFPP